MPSSSKISQKASMVAHNARNAVNAVFHKKKSTPVDGKYVTSKKTNVSIIDQKHIAVFNAPSGPCTQKRPRSDALVSRPSVREEADVCTMSVPIVAPREAEALEDWVIFDSLLNTSTLQCTPVGSIGKVTDMSCPRSSSNEIPPQSSLKRKPRVGRQQRPPQQRRKAPTQQVTAPVVTPINNSPQRPIRPIPICRGGQAVPVSISTTSTTHVPVQVNCSSPRPTRPLPCKKGQVTATSAAIDFVPPPIFAQKNDFLECLFPDKKVSTEDAEMEELWLELFGPE